jgi:hypothetical protein
VSSFAIAFRPREISRFCSREAAFPRPRISCSIDADDADARIFRPWSSTLSNSAEGGAPSRGLETSAGESSTHRQAPEERRSVRQLVPLLRTEVAGAHLRNVDAPFAADHAVCDLLARHFEREHDDADALLVPATTRVAVLRGLGRRDVDGHVENEAGLSHAGTRGDDGEIAVVQSCGQSIEPFEACRDARDPIAALERFGELLERFLMTWQALDARLL